MVHHLEAKQDDAFKVVTDLDAFYSGYLSEH